MEKNEKISVIMGIYNCADTLPEAIDSILAQTYTNWELIMCDDGSSDDTYLIAKKYKEKYPKKIILIRNETNKKLAYSLNHCLKYATGKYIARMDGDDISAPERFEKQVRYLQEHPNIDLVGTAMQQFNDQDGKLRIIFQQENPDRWCLRYSLPFHHATILTYAYVFEQLNGYLVLRRTERCEDKDLWYRFFFHGFNGSTINEPLYYVRENINAIKRRNIQAKWNSLQTSVVGFRLLGYPKHWLIPQASRMFLKCLIPAKIKYRIKKNRNKKCTHI